MKTSGSVSFDSDLKKEYVDLYSSCVVSPGKRGVVAALAEKVRSDRARYEALQAVTGVRWFVVGAIHQLESGGSFDRHLHNGDSLSWRTVHAPKDRPPAQPPFTWEESAADALEVTGLSGWNDWSLAGTLYRLEMFHGFGYR